jgi:hypothetical protein
MVNREVFLSMISIAAPRAILEQLLTGYLSAGEPEYPGEYAMAQQFAALPIYGDFIGCWGLAMDGRLVYLPDEPSARPEPVENIAANIIGAHVAFAIVARRYPQLAVYCPQRPADAPDCRKCDGSGSIPGVPAHILCGCGGSGWLPAGVQAQPPDGDS